MYGPMAGYPAHFVAPQFWQAPQFPRGHLVSQRVMTQAGSPPLTLAVPMPKIVVDQNGQLEHAHMLDSRQSSPPTPSLSACPSTASSPPASSVNQTPIHGHGYFTLPLDPTKDEMPTLPLMEDWSDSTRKY